MDWTKDLNAIGSDSNYYAGIVSKYWSVISYKLGVVLALGHL